MSSYRGHPDELVTSPRRGGVLRRILATLLLVAAITLVAGLVWLVFALRGGSNVPAGQKVKVTIARSATAGDIADELADAGVVGNRTLFMARLRMNGDGSKFRAGTYTMTTGMDYSHIVRKLEQGPPAAPVYDVTFPEGFRLTQMAAKIDDLHQKAVAEGDRTPSPAFGGADYTKAVGRLEPPTGMGVPDGTTSMEGFLFPATFELKDSATADVLVGKQLDAYRREIASLDMTRARKANLTPYDVTIIASMVEREARVASERPIIAAVIWNRLKLGMSLGIDATIQYAVSDVDWKTELTKSDLAIDSPYNTRTNAGLPPTPIANPGAASLEAAANPAKVDYLYYVAKTDGSGKHFFTKDYDEFLAHQ